MGCSIILTLLCRNADVPYGKCNPDFKGLANVTACHQITVDNAVVWISDCTLGYYVEN